MKHLRNILLLFSGLMLLSACGAGRQTAYFADAPREAPQPIAATYQGAIHQGDLLHIFVASGQPESTIPFNAETNKGTAIRSDRTALLPDGMATAAAPGYLVDQQGCILFPVLGTLRVEGLTLDSLNNLIANKLRENNLILDAQVTSRLLNFRVAVLGEVKLPRWVPGDGNRLTILEALAQAGDMTVYGVPSKVKVFREVNGQLTVGEVDMTSRELFASPYYYLQQNDVVFVQPNRVKRKEYSRDEFIQKYISLGVQIGAFTSTTARAIYQYVR